MHTTLIDCATLAAALGRPDWVVVDCRFDLAQPEAGRRGYLAGHVPGAVYTHLDHDLSGPRGPASGRHPLPSPPALAQTFGRLGIGPGVQVVACDAGGGLFAGRLWWLLRYMDHAAVAVLDGGWPAWRAAGGSVQTGEVQPVARRFEGEPQADRVVTVDQVLAAPLLVDARDPARYRGEHEPLDPVAGHIPGARNRYCRDNLGADGRFLPAATLREHYLQLLGDTPVHEVVFYCGSGVTACHDLLALAHAGLGDARLYAGSWSEWCRDPTRPIAVGPAPVS
ncbi:MAG: sulfurtransferase [Gammaproteobacteria bacterium]|nr:sulfurtransferase [Gammaproteobacteria bacterium]